MHLGLFNNFIDVSHLEYGKSRDFSDLLSNLGIHHCRYEHGDQISYLCSNDDYFIAELAFELFSAKELGKDLNLSINKLYRLLENKFVTY